MIQLILFLVALFFLFRKETKVSGTRKITRPNSFILSGLFLVSSVLISFIPVENILYTVLLFIILIIASIFLSKKTEDPKLLEKDKKEKKKFLKDLIIFLIILPIVVGIVYLLIFKL